MQINHIYFGGNLTASPELKTLPNGTKVVQFTIASNRKWRDADGGEKEAVEFGNCVLFGKQAEVFGKYAIKGQTFLIEGRMQTRSYEKEGQKHYRTEIVVEKFHFGQKPHGGARTDAVEGLPDTESDDWLNDVAPTRTKEQVTASMNDNLERQGMPTISGEGIDPNDIPF